MKSRNDLLEKALNTYRQVISIEHFSYLKNDLELFWSQVLCKDRWPLDVIENFGTTEEFISELRNLLEEQNKSPNKFKSKRIVDWVDIDFVNSKALYFNRYLKYSSTKGISINVLQTDVINILNGCGNPLQDEAFLHKGLVYGEVQSGKTANYAGVINCAFDLGYKLVIVLAGITNKLRDQTEGRLIEAVTGRIGDNRIGVGVLAYSSNLDSVRLISGDVSIDHYETLKDVVREKDSLLFVVKKNPNSLTNLIKLILNLKGDSDVFMNSCLLIDDECDHASLRSMSSKEFAAYNENISAGELLNQDDILKAINARIRIILSLMYRCSYIGYTATPYSVVLQRSLDIERQHDIGDMSFIIDENTDLFPEDFITLIRPGRGYLGLADIFRADGGIGKDVLRIASRESINSLDFLKDKFHEFLVQTYIMNFRNDSNHWFEINNRLINEKFSIWMIHPDHHVNHINFTAEILHEIYLGMKEQITDLQSSRRLIDKLNEILSDFRSKSVAILGALSYEVYQDSYVFPASIEKNILLKIIDKIQFIILHSSKERPSFSHLNEINYESLNCPLIQIVVGGNILSRGTTFPGLVMSTLSREATRADSLYQMARWNGYRIGYEDLVKIDMLESIAINFQIVFKIDETLRRDLYSLKDEFTDLRPEDWELSVLNLVRRYESKSGTRSSFVLTGKERIRSAVRANISKSGHSVFLNDYSLSEIDSNFEHALDFIHLLNENYNSRYESDYRRYIMDFTEERYSRIFLDVNRNEIRDYFGKYESGKIINNGELESCLNDENIIFNVVIKSLKNHDFVNERLQTLHYNINLNSFSKVPISVVGRSILKNIEDQGFVRITSILDSDKERHIDLINSHDRKDEFQRSSVSGQKYLMKKYRQADNSCLLILYFVKNSDNSRDYLHVLRQGQIMSIPYLIMPKYEIGKSVLIRT
ncbi:MAG: hypothetical protein HQ490_05880 [Lutibacter sp.]|nr:hypothetical protein [Lutibacter sp.]